MSFANFGIGVNALAQGLSSGIQTGKMLTDLYKEGQINRANKQGMEDAKAARAADADKMIKVGSAANADNTMTVPTYDVEGQQFTDRDKASEAAQQKVGSLEDYYQTVAAPKIYEKYLEIDPQKAAVWKEWSDNQKVKQGMKHWADSVRSAQAGDFEGFGKNFVKAVNNNHYYGDGITATGVEPEKDEQGNVTGLTLKLKDANGKPFDHYVEGSMDSLMRMGINYMAPEKMFELGYASVLNAEKLRATAAQDQLKFQQKVLLQKDQQGATADLLGLKQNGMERLEDKRQQGRVDLEGQRGQNRIEVAKLKADLSKSKAGGAFAAKIDALRGLGIPDETIKEYGLQLAGVGPRRATSTQDTFSQVYRAKAASDLNFATKTEQEKVAEVQQAVTLLQQAAAEAEAAGKQQSAPQQAAPAQQITPPGANPLSQGLNPPSSGGFIQLPQGQVPYR